MTVTEEFGIEASNRRLTKEQPAMLSAWPSSWQRIALCGVHGLGFVPGRPARKADDQPNKAQEHVDFYHEVPRPNAHRSSRSPKLKQEAFQALINAYLSQNVANPMCSS
jgi:hypothetical protein